MRAGKWLTLSMLALTAVAVTFASLPAFAEEAADEPKYMNEDTAKPGWVPLKLELPKPMFVGTPKDIKTDNLEKITGKKRKPFLVPEGVKNVAFEKEVTASEMEPIIGDLE
ncbi:MAG: hypothetical protein GY851_30160, partial [bacterium]|nr:hypothetical protein [bacterium]